MNIGECAYHAQQSVTRITPLAKTERGNVSIKYNITDTALRQLQTKHILPCHLVACSRSLPCHHDHTLLEAFFVFFNCRTKIFKSW